MAFPERFGHQGAQGEQGTPSLAAFEHTESPLLVYLVLMEVMQATDPKQGTSNGAEPLVQKDRTQGMCLPDSCAEWLCALIISVLLNPLLVLLHPYWDIKHLLFSFRFLCGVRSLSVL